MLKTKSELDIIWSENITKNLSQDYMYVLEWVTPESLLSENRVDIVAKYLFVKSILDELDTDYYKELYLSHIKAFNGFYEADESRKIGSNEFLSSFKDLISSFKTSGFLEGKPIPISKSGIPLDGAHRIACALAFSVKVPVIKTMIESPVFDMTYFSDRGLDSAFMDAMSLEYACLKKNCRVVVIWPAAQGRLDDVEGILTDAGGIVTSKNIYLTESGKKNITALAYGGEPWIGSQEDGYAGAGGKASCCFSNEGPVRVYLFESNANLLIMKERIRGLFGIGKHSIHINDTHPETVELSQCLFNDNSLQHLNGMQHIKFGWFNKLFSHLIRWVEDENLDIQDFCIDGSGSLAAFGIRDVRDIDYLQHGLVNLGTGFKEIDCHNDGHEHIGLTVDDIIFNPNNHFYYKGVKFVSINLLRKMKTERNETKDVHDVRSIDEMLSGTKVPLRFIVKARRWFTPVFVKSKVKLYLLKGRYFLVLLMAKVRVNHE